MLDEEHAIPPYDTHYDSNTYICGMINGHAIIIPTCPHGETGNVNAGRLAGPMFKTFLSIRITELVGIGGGILRSITSEDPLNDIHLGDVVVGWPSDGKHACVYYGRGRLKANGLRDCVVIASNSVIQDGQLRDQISARRGEALCIEMEAAGFNVNRPCLVTFGICDYADTHKNDIWRSYTAGNAAAFTRELLCRIQPNVINEMEGVTEAPISYRKTVNEFQYMALEAVEIQPLLSVEKAFEQSFRDIGKLLHIPEITDEKVDVKGLVKAKLSYEGFGQWLMIVDNVEDVSVLFDPLEKGALWID
ncbi:hypothetical protein GQ43DRAFT_497820 [Delitschia confertaspora ATCC 74209]|uniref:Nucleoside phosphorylase domain-containing protein n=1 Tax=Delitschia confertaspora ATCC 74209 TaxID=1513339 RepID=A0A9P4MS69_9PLEO|nr:hypothetical protein GQ43DRAFT_497820 [Delitschia confertaspora ATCC 74209]